MTDSAPKVYRKKRAAGVILRAAVIVLAILLLLAVLLFFGLRKYIAYTDTGKLYLDIPWLAGYMDGKPEDDPLFPELTLTGDSYREEQIPAEPLPEHPAEDTAPETSAPGEEAPSPGPGDVPEG